MKFLSIIFIAIISYATNIEILAKHFEYNQTSNISIFTGDVNVTKGNDNILSDTLYVYTTNQKKLAKIIAIGHVKFKVTDKNSTYKGKSDKLTYIASKQLFVFEGNVNIIKLDDNQQLFGDKVIINKKEGSANITGSSNKPIKFILKVKE